MPRFQSTLPRGSDANGTLWLGGYPHFNPRSLAGATYGVGCEPFDAEISIHAPSRERLLLWHSYGDCAGISIHAPSRERPCVVCLKMRLYTFQSTLPRGSDVKHLVSFWCNSYFNPRSLAGATKKFIMPPKVTTISIHAPSRERPLSNRQPKH